VKPRPGRVHLALCACRREVLVARHIIDDTVIGADHRFVSTLEEAEAHLQGRPVYELGSDHTGASWLLPLHPNGCQRRLLGLEPPRLTVLDHLCPKETSYAA
jgi:hypothetical protein